MILIHKKKLQRAFSRGFSLIELLIVLSIITFILFTFSFLMTAMGNYKFTSIKNVEKNDELYLLDLILPNYLTYAINVDWTNAAIGNIGASRGRLRNYSSSLSGNPNRQPMTIGVYLRDEGLVNGESDLRATGIYFRNPTVNSPGELYFASSGTGTGAFLLSPSTAAQKISNLVELEIAPSGLINSSEDVVRSIRLRVVYRKQLTPDQSLWRWCPRSLVGSNTNCQSEANYKDFEKIYDYILVNNLIESNAVTSSGLPRKEGLFGRTYFFKARVQ